MLEAACRGIQEDASFDIEGDKQRERERQRGMQGGASFEKDREIETDRQRGIHSDPSSDLQREILKQVSIAFPCMGRKRGDVQYVCERDTQRHTDTQTHRHTDTLSK